VAQAAAPSRRERKKLEVRGRILESAITLFDADGFHATTVAEICESADVAHKTFFNYFPSKQHLLRKIAERALENLLGLIDEVRQGNGTASQRLQKLFVRIAEDIEQGPMHRELLTEMIHVAHESRTESEQARLLQAAFEGLIRDGRAAGDLDTGARVDTQTELVLGAFYALMFNWAHHESYRLRRQARALAQLVGQALAPGGRQ
jgi:AcrR family transcriptional regulator